MCGFLGEISDDLTAKQDFIKLLNLSIHRGPDHQDLWSKGNCQIGFNRLAILDTTIQGNQPIESPSGRFILVFNGEIYNYKELICKYGLKEEHLRSTSDTEVIAHLLDELSVIELAKALNGMFAIAVWDVEQEKLYLIRDFAGIKPLFYGIKDSNIVFASQFDQIFKHSLFENKELRPEIMKEFFGIGYMHAPNTVFKNIFQLEPGQLIVWDNKNQSITTKILYYKWDVKPKMLDSLVETKNKFIEMISNVVKLQLQSDVSIATFLSAGYDSSLVTSFAKIHKNDIKAVTFGIETSELDESQHAKEYAKHLGIDHEILRVKNEELLKSIDKHFDNMPEPFGDYSSIPSFLTTKEGRKKAKVMLAGDGGDELFWGYPRFRKSLNQAYWFKYPLWLRKLIVPFLRKKNKKLSAALTVTKSFSDWILEKQVHFTNLNELFSINHFSKELYSLYSFKSRLTKPNVLQYLKKNEFYAHMQRTLKKVDLTSMANSLEVRVPFLDKKTIEFSNSVISEFTITHDRPKLILKDALYDYIPIEKIEKQKKGFSVPIKDWLEKDLKQDFLETVLETSFFGEEHIDKTVLHTLVNDFYLRKRKVDPWGLWHLYAWQKWAINNDLVIR